MRSARAFLRGIIDYAGLFPPASLGMDASVRAYSTHRAGPDRDLLGRFVIPAARLTEFAESAGGLLPRSWGERWQLSVIGGRRPDVASSAALAFNSSHADGSDRGHAECDMIELLASSEDDVQRALAVVPDSIQLYLEIPVSAEPGNLLTAIAGTRAAAKIRTGGVTPDAVPSAHDVLRFMRACNAHGVPFKATAGLHHAVRADYALTYEADSPVATMFGYLNIFLAAAALEAEWPDDVVLSILEERDPARFAFDDTGVSVGDRRLGMDQLERSRANFARSFGSCSFTDPVNEARALALV